MVYPPAIAALAEPQTMLKSHPAFTKGKNRYYPNVRHFLAPSTPFGTFCEIAIRRQLISRTSDHIAMSTQARVYISIILIKKPCVLYGTSALVHTSYRQNFPMNLYVDFCMNVLFNYLFVRNC